MLYVGFLFYSWLYFYAFGKFINAFYFWDVLKDDGFSMTLWIFGPARRAVVGTLIFFCQSLTAFIPFTNILTSLLFGTWAIFDYYDYSYVLFNPQQP